MTDQEVDALGDLLLRPSWDKRGIKRLRQNWPWVLGSSGMALAFSLTAAVRDPSWIANVSWPAGGIALVGGLVALEQRHRLFVRGDVFGESGWPFWRRRAFPVADVGSIRRVYEAFRGSAALAASCSTQ